jgi:hypothetical protein
VRIPPEFVRVRCGSLGTLFTNLIVAIRQKGARYAWKSDLRKGRERMPCAARTLAGSMLCHRRPSHTLWQLSLTPCADHPLFVARWWSRAGGGRASDRGLGRNGWPTNDGDGASLHSTAIRSAAAQYDRCCIALWDNRRTSAIHRGEYRWPWSEPRSRAGCGSLLHGAKQRHLLQDVKDALCYVTSGNCQRATGLTPAGISMIDEVYLGPTIHVFRRLRGTVPARSGQLS